MAPTEYSTRVKRHYDLNGIYPQGLYAQWKRYGFKVVIVMVKDKKNTA